MVRYDVLGFGSFEEYVEAFMSSLVPTNRTYDFFVDWGKVRRNVRRFIKEISLLNALTKVASIDERRELLREILERYPETVPVIPYIIAVRERSLAVLELGDSLVYRFFRFDVRRLSLEEVEDLVVFAERTGILELMGEISDLYAYFMGMEVGLDTNARKNRSGRVFQGLVGLILRRVLGGVAGVRVVEEVPVRRLGLRIRRQDKRLDFVVYFEGRPRLAVECNFYNVTGSKPLEVAEAYVELNRLLKERGIAFVWITDGPAWRLMRTPFIQAAKEIDYVLNLKMTGKYMPRICKVFGLSASN